MLDWGYYILEYFSIDNILSLKKSILPPLLSKDYNIFSCYTVTIYENIKNSKSKEYSVNNQKPDFSLFEILEKEKELDNQLVTLIIKSIILFIVVLFIIGYILIDSGAGKEMLELVDPICGLYENNKIIRYLGLTFIVLTIVYIPLKILERIERRGQ